MFSRAITRRPLFHALTAWLCAALQLAVFTASGWHVHGPNTPTPCTADLNRPCLLAPDDRGDSPHSDHQTPTERSHDRPGPDDCNLCKAILALGHAAPPVTVLLVLAPPGALAQPPAHPQVCSIAARGPRCARGPPNLAPTPSFFIV